MAKRDLSLFIGTKYNKLTIIGIGQKDKQRNVMVVCLCECGNQTIAKVWDLANNKKKSCGCLLAEQKEIWKTINKSHGMSNHPLDSVYSSMIQRCYNPRCSGYKNYGGRGIKVCDEWKDDINSFLNWGLSNSWAKGLELDRKDNDKNYGPDNCRFVTKLVNSRNKRNNYYVVYKGEKKTLKEWCEKFSLNFSTMRHRLYDEKLAPEIAFERPIGRWASRHIAPK